MQQKPNIQLSTAQIKKLAKGKSVSLETYIIQPKATSYKDMVKTLRRQVYTLRYQLKKTRNGGAHGQ